MTRPAYKGYSYHLPGKAGWFPCCHESTSKIKARLHILKVWRLARLPKGTKIEKVK